MKKILSSEHDTKNSIILLITKSNGMLYEETKYLCCTMHIYTKGQKLTLL